MHAIAYDLYQFIASFRCVEEINLMISIQRTTTRRLNAKRQTNEQRKGIQRQFIADFDAHNTSTAINRMNFGKMK